VHAERAAGQDGRQLYEVGEDIGVLDCGLEAAGPAARSSGAEEINHHAVAVRVEVAVPDLPPERVVVHP